MVLGVALSKLFGLLEHFVVGEVLQLTHGLVLIG
jgi:hypothetical protein